MTSRPARAGSSTSAGSLRGLSILTVYAVVLVLSVVVGVLAVLQACPSMEGRSLVVGCSDFRASNSISGNLGAAIVTAFFAVVIGIVASTVMRRRISLPGLLVWASVGLLYLSLQATLVGQAGGLQVMGAALAVIGAVSGLWAGIGLCQTRTP